MKELSHDHRLHGCLDLSILCDDKYVSLSLFQSSDGYKFRKGLRKEKMYLFEKEVDQVVCTIKNQNDHREVRLRVYPIYTVFNSTECGGPCLFSNHEDMRGRQLGLI